MNAIATINVAFHSCEILHIKTVYSWLLSVFPTLFHQIDFFANLSNLSPTKLSTFTVFEHLNVGNKTKCFSYHTVDEGNCD